MLTPEDIEFMKETRKEIIANRQHPIEIFYEIEGERDPITDEIIGSGTDSRELLAVVTEIASQSQIDKLLLDGIIVEKGDIWFSVELETIADILTKIESVKYDKKEYEVLTHGKKGIGERNRVEFVGRLIS